MDYEFMYFIIIELAVSSFSNKPLLNFKFENEKKRYSFFFFFLRLNDRLEGKYIPSSLSQTLCSNNEQDKLFS